MKGKRKRIIAAIAVIGALAAGGAAFTYSNTMPTENVAGYGNIAVSGADVTDISNTLSADGQNITQVDLTFSNVVPQDATVKVGWGPTAGTAPASLSLTCTLALDGQSATCGDGTTNLQSVSTANEFAVAVSH